MAKVRVSFDVDLGKLAPDAFEAYSDPIEAAESVLEEMLFDQARMSSLAEMRMVQANKDLSKEQRALLMAACLRKAMVPMQARANLQVELLPEDALIQTDHPIEHRYAA